MKIIVAKEAGFCFGVKRASDMAIKEASHENLNTFGPLIHNSEFIKFLEKKGVFVAKNLSEIKAKKVIIRSHGISCKLEKKIKEKNIKIADATCPFVKRVQKLAENLEKEGYKVLILGEKNHPEVVGIKSYAPKAKVIKSIKDISGFKLNQKLALISQTTQNTKLFEELTRYLKSKFKNFKAINTICDASVKRQNAARQLAKKVDIMVVIGGKNSSNTTRLAEICGKITKTYHIENEKELKRVWFTPLENKASLKKKNFIGRVMVVKKKNFLTGFKKVETIGITAGASTPDFSIKAVVLEIKKLNLSEFTARKTTVGFPSEKTAV